MPWNGTIATLQSFAPPPAEYGFSVSEITLFGVDVSPFNADVALFFDADGGIRGRNESGGNKTTTDRGVWSTAHPDEEDGADYEVMVEYISGTDTYQTGAFNLDLDVWYSLDSNRQYVWNHTNLGLVSGVYQASIRDVATETVINTIEITVNLEVFI